MIRFQSVTAKGINRRARILRHRFPHDPVLQQVARSALAGDPAAREAVLIRWEEQKHLAGHSWGNPLDVSGLLA